MKRWSKRELLHEVEELMAEVSEPIDVPDISKGEKEALAVLLDGEPYEEPSFTEEEAALIRDRFGVSPEEFPEYRRAVLEEWHEGSAGVAGR